MTAEQVQVTFAAGRSAVLLTGGQTATAATRHKWRALVRCHYAGRANGAFVPRWLDAGFVWYVAGLSRGQAIFELQLRAAEHLFDRVEVVELCPPMGESERAMVEALAKKVALPAEPFGAGRAQMNRLVRA